MGKKEKGNKMLENEEIANVIVAGIADATLELKSNGKEFKCECVYANGNTKQVDKYAQTINSSGYTKQDTLRHERLKSIVQINQHK